MWIPLAFGSAALAGLTSILAKAGIRNVNSNLATALRTVVVLLFSWLMVWITGSWRSLASVDGRFLVFLILSGLATGASWLCYFRALQLGEASRVAAIDKSSTVLTILLALVLLHEPVNWLTGLCAAAITLGTFLMLPPRRGQAPAVKKWIPYAFGSAIFASLQAILAKVGMAGVESNLGTALRTVVVLVMAWVLVLLTGRQREIRRIDRKSWLFLVLSGLSTGGSWLCFYRAIQTGPASVVVPIDKLSILVTAAVASRFFHERLSRRGRAGLALIVAGTLSLLIPV